MFVTLQGDCRSYSHVVGLSSAEIPTEWEDLINLAKIIPRICHNVNRVCYIFGGIVKHPVQDVTPTYLTPQVLSTLREADHIAQTKLISSGYYSSVAQMPVILIPIHFDRDIASRAPSCQRSVVLRTLITEDFMTGIPAIPNKHIPLDVSGNLLFLFLSFLFDSLIFSIFCFPDHQRYCGRSRESTWSITSIVRSNSETSCHH